MKDLLNYFELLSISLSLSLFLLSQKWCLLKFKNWSLGASTTALRLRVTTRVANRRHIWTLRTLLSDGIHTAKLNSWMVKNLTNQISLKSGSFAAVSKPNFASKYSLESSRRDPQNALLCTVL